MIDVMTDARTDVTATEIALEDAHVAHNYHPLPVVIAEAEGLGSPM